MASWTPVIRPVPKIGWTMIASYLPDAVAFCSCANCVFGSLLASKTVSVGVAAFAVAWAAASIGAS